MIAICELEAGRAWVRSHRCGHGVKRKMRQYYWKLKMTEIGTVVWVVCEHCNREKNVTDYNSW